MSYNNLVLSLFFNPEHAGILEKKQRGKIGRFVDASQNQRIDFYVDYQSSGSMCSICYLVKGNPYIIAGAEWMAQAVEKTGNGTILTDMTPQYWLDLFAIPKLEKRIAVSLSQAANVLYETIQSI